MSDPISGNDYTINIKKPVCTCEVLPGCRVNLTEWPSLWVRLWHRVFFGWRWRPYEL